MFVWDISVIEMGEGTVRWTDKFVLAAWADKEIDFVITPAKQTRKSNENSFCQNKDSISPTSQLRGNFIRAVKLAIVTTSDQA